jgi:RND family efflux transporter MFP subunit
MHLQRRRLIPIVLIIVVVGGGLWWWQSQVASATPSTITASGTIEATQFVVAPEIAGRIAAIAVHEGDHVVAGQAVVAFDTQLLEAQRAQALAALDAAQQSAVAAELQEKLQRSSVDNVLGRTRVAQAQAAAASAQVEAAQAAVRVLDVQLSKLWLTVPISGTVLERSVEPGEMALPGATLLTLADLDHLKITVYVPEDRYSAISLGQSASVTVDSWPGETFAATVDHIADTAEFTPRNVQTTAGRKTTVFAIRLRIDNHDGKLKAGSPADVTFLP